MDKGRRNPGGRRGGKGGLIPLHTTMINEQEAILLINQVELHLRNIRTELNEAGRGLDRLRKGF